MIIDYLEYKKKVELLLAELNKLISKRQALLNDVNKTENEILFLKGRIKALQEILSVEVPGNSIADVKSGIKPAAEVKD